MNALRFAFKIRTQNKSIAIVSHRQLKLYVNDAKHRNGNQI